MSPGVTSAPLPTKPEIEEWSTSHLSDAATTWRTAATGSETAFDEHRQHISSPGGTTWEGNAKDAALDRVTADIGVVGRQNGVLRAAADLAENGSHDIKAALDKALEAIKAAEDDGFRVADDLSVSDTKRVDVLSMRVRQTSLNEHAEDIRWAAEQLMATDKLVGDRLEAKASELEGIRFEGEGGGQEAPPNHVQLVDNKVDKPSDDARGEKLGPAEQATGHVGPFAVPKSVEDAAKKSGLKPDEKPPAKDDGGLGALMGADDSLEVKPGDEKHAGLPPALSQLPPAPEKATIDQQRARVEAAQQKLAAAEAKQKGAAGAGYVQGAGSGPTPDEFKSLTQAVFDARRELTEQTDALREMSAASVASGGPTVPVAPLPPDADKQAFPPPPSISDTLADANHQLSENTFGLIPDVAKDIDTLNNWGQASTEDKAQVILDSAGMLPLPFGKPLAEGLEHGIDALGGAARHFDDAPTPHGHVDAPAGGHGTVDAPAAGPAPVDVPHSVDHGPVGHVDDTTPPVEHHGHSDTRAEHHAGGDGAGDSPSVGDHPTHAGDALANASEAVIDPRKFEGYSMDPSNVNNGGKWQAWQQIGYDVDTDVGRQSAASDVVAQIQSQLGSTPAEALPATKWGDRYQVNVPISGPSGDGTLVTVWQVENGVPRMITNFLKVWK